MCVYGCTKIYLSGAARDVHQLARGIGPAYESCTNRLPSPAAVEPDSREPREASDTGQRMKNRSLRLGRDTSKPTPPPTQPPFEHTGSRACPGRPANPANWQVTARPATPRAPARQLAGRGARPPAGRSVSQSVDQPTNRPTSQPASRPPAGGPCMHAFPRHPAIACGLQSRPAGVVAPSGPVPPPPTGPPTSIGRRSCVQTFPGPKVIRGGPTRNPDPKSARQLAGPRRTVPITGQPATEAR